MNVLVVAPHPDDESIGCGGTVRLHVERGDRVEVVFLTSGELGLEELEPDEARTVREREAEHAAAILGIADLSFLRHPDWFLGDAHERARADLLRLVERRSPQRLLVPHGEEGHPDHAAAAKIVEGVVADLGQPVEIAAYEVWTPMREFDEVEDITPVFETKMAAVRSYRSQLTKFRYDVAVDGLNRFRGALAGHCDYAEVFRAFSD